MTDVLPRRNAVLALCIGTVAALLVLAPDWRWRFGVAMLPIATAVFCWMVNSPVRWVVLFFASTLCLPPLPIALGDSGPHVGLAFAGIGLFVGVMRLGEWRAPLPRRTLLLFLLLLAIFASISFAGIYSGASLAAASFARACLFGTSVYLFFYTAAGPGSIAARDPAPWIRWLFAAGVISALFACLDFYYQFPAPSGYGPQFIWLASGVYRRAQGFFYEASTLGNLCAFFLTMVAVALTQPNHTLPVSKKYLLAGSAVITGALILSFSRASLFNLAAGMTMLAWLRRERLQLGRVCGVLLGSLLVAVFVSWIFAPEAAGMYWLRLNITGESLLAGEPRVLSGRLETWTTLGRFLMEHPQHAVFGVGYKTLPYSDFTGSPIVADNAYLSALIETGIAGLTALLLVHATILSLALKASRHADRWASFFGTWVACFWAGEIVQMMSGDLLTYWRVMPLYLWVLAIAVVRSRP